MGNNSSTINELPFISSNDDRIFIAEYGVTTFTEIFEAVQSEGKSAICHMSDGSTLPLAYAHLDEIKFVGHTSDGQEEVFCSMDNVWSSNTTETFATEEYVDSKLQIQSADETVTLQKDILFYEAQVPKRGLDIEGTFSNIPYGWVAYLTILGSGNDSVSSTILETTSINGFTLSEFDVNESFTMAIFKHRGKNKLQWYLFKPLPAAEGASF